MTRSVLALMCVAFVGGTTSAGEPVDAYRDRVQAEESAEAALSAIKSARRKYAFVQTAIVERGDGSCVKPALVLLNGCEAEVLKARTAIRRAVVRSRALALSYAVAGRPVIASDYHKTVADDLQKLIGDAGAAESPYGTTLTAIEDVRKWLADPTMPAPKAVETLADALAKAESESARLADGLSLGDEKQRLVKMLRRIRETQTRIVQEFHDSRNWCGPSDGSKVPVLKERSKVVLGKGDRVVLQQRIEWRQYQEDDLEITVTTSDPSLTVPAKLKLDFEKHQFRFEYEVKAGAKAGEFEVKLTPRIGKSVKIKVTVK